MALVGTKQLPISTDTQSMTLDAKLKRVKEIVKKNKDMKSRLHSPPRSKPYLAEKHQSDVQIIPVNRNIISLDQFPQEFLARISDQTSVPKERRSKSQPKSTTVIKPGSEPASVRFSIDNKFNAGSNTLLSIAPVTSMSAYDLNNLSSSPMQPVTTPTLRRASSWDAKDITNINRQSISSSPDSYLQQETKRQQQSMAIVNLSQSMNKQTMFDRPFQDLPMNIHLPELSEFAEETGVIMEGFLLKKSSFFGVWQKVRLLILCQCICVNGTS
jgi:hypothetical protein